MPILKLSHLEDRKTNEGQKVYKFTIYENTKEQYFTFCSPEATNYIDAYLDYRTRSGEKLTKDAYLIREQFDVTDLEQVRKKGAPSLPIFLFFSLFFIIELKNLLRQV